MSAKKLKLHQKMFTLIEGLISETKVRSLNFKITPEFSDIRTAIPVSVCNAELITSKEIRKEKLKIEPKVLGLIELFKKIKLNKLPFDFTDTKSTIYNFDQIKQVQVKKWDFNWGIVVTDFFKKFKTSRSLNYKTLTHYLKMKIVTSISRSKLEIVTKVKDNCLLVKRMYINRLPVELSTVNKSKQLQYWKKLLIETKQHPSEFQLVGIYAFIPYNKIKNIKIDQVTNRLRYKVDLLGERKMEYSDIALFQEIVCQKTILIKL